MQNVSSQFASRGPKLVWVLTIAALLIAGGGLFLIRFFMANASIEREAALNVQTQVLGVTDSFSNEVASIEAGLSAMIETDRADLNTVRTTDYDSILTALLTKDTFDVAARNNLPAIHRKYQEAIAALQGTASELHQWHVNRDKSLAERSKAEAAVREQISKMRAELTTLLGSSRLKRLGLLAKYRKAAEADKLAQADTLVALGDSLTTVMPLERELADLLSIVQQLTDATDADIARDLVNNQLSQSLDRLQRALTAASSSTAAFGAFNGEDFPVLLLHLLGADGHLDADTKAVVVGSGGLLATIDSHRQLLGKSAEFRAKTQSQVQHARAVLADFVSAANHNTSLQVMRSNQGTARAWTSIGILTCVAAIAILALGAFIARSIQRQAQSLETTNRELDKASALASAANTAKSAFLANMSHEIRTPMTAILGYADLLSDPTLSEAEKAGHVSTIRRNGEHLVGIINDILDISKIEAGKMTLESIDTPVTQLAQDIVTLMRPRAAVKNLSIETNLIFPLPSHIKADPLRLRQVLVNLLSNAVKFTESGGIRLQISYVNATLKFEIIDTGIGMSAEQALKLFKPFTQADDSMSRRFGGTGLGLAISQRLISMMGGTIQINSTLNVGTTFWFALPIGQLQASELVSHAPATQAKGAQAATPLAATPLAGLRIVLAEDGLDNQRLISFHLKKAGAKVDICDNGRIAVELISTLNRAKQLPDVILMDMQMPEMDGYEASRTLRTMGINLPIFALTAHAMAGDREKCLAAGCSDYLTKPVDRAQLIAAISNATQSRRAAA